ncbi:MAG: anti-sigma factor [Actinomycetota bacterium]|nr:anti-sigma factor [Actinomycetota bacterium]
MSLERFDHGRLKESVAAFAIGALEEDEREEVLRHLETCDECRDEFDGFATVAHWLALLHEPPPLPSGFQERVVAEARRGRPTQARPPLRSRQRALRWLGAAAAVVVLVIASVALTLSLASPGDESDRQRTAIDALVESDQRIALTGASPAVGAVVSGGDGAVFVATDLRAAPSEFVYQLWLKQGARIVSAGVFEPRDGIAIVRIDEAFTDLDGALVTVEPPGGSAQPTAAPVLDSI